MRSLLLHTTLIRALEESRGSSSARLAGNQLLCLIDLDALLSSPDERAV